MIAIKTRTNHLEISITARRLWIGLVMAALSWYLCVIAGGSSSAKRVLPVMFVAISVVEIRCSPCIGRILTGIWAVGAVFVTVFTSQLLLNEDTFSLGIQRIALNMALCGVTMGLVYLVSARLRLSVITGMAVLMIFTAANYFVFMFRGSELCPADFLSLGTAFAVADRYTFKINGPFAYSMILAAVYAFAIFSIHFDIRGENNRHRIPVSVGMILLLAGLYFGSEGIVALHFLVNGSVTNGYILNFTLQIRESIQQKPKGYDLSIIEEIEKEYKATDDPEKKNGPDIIVIMNESYTDLRVLGSDIQSNMDIMPYFDSISDNVIRGNLLCSVFGGSTPNSEYEFLTGNTMGFLPKGSIPYQQFITGSTYSIAEYMGKLGYSSMATHPQPKENWIRYLRYPDLGFEEMFFIENYPQVNLIREYVSDQEMYEQIIKWYEENISTRPVFCFGITMQNHGFYDYKGLDFVEEIELAGYSNEYLDVKQYVSLIHYSDKALKTLVNYFENVERDVVILFYGDHFPNLNSSFYEEVHGGTFDTLDEQMLQYTVPFFIWANYDIEEKNVELTSINFLSNLLFEVAGLELPAYNQFLRDLNAVIPAMNSFGYYSKEQGKFVPYEDAAGIEAEWLQKYRCLQYNCMFDQENTSKVFFPVYDEK